MKIYYVLILSSLLVIGCGKTQKPNDSQKTEKSVITDWARPGAQGQMSGAYFVYKNELDVTDTLISVKSSEASMTQIHESYTTDDGLAGMRELKQITVNPGEELVLKQGGLHVMLMGLKQNLTASDSVSIALTFSQAGEVNLKVPVLTSN